MIEGLRKNVDTEIAMLREISDYTARLSVANQQEKKLLLGAIGALRSSIKIINKSIPGMLSNISAANKLPTEKAHKIGIKIPSFENITFRRKDSNIDVTLNVKDRERLLKELSIGENLIKKLSKKKADNSEKYEEFKAARGYLKLSNKYFLNRSIDLINKGYFKSLSTEIKKSNMDVLFEAYVAMILFSTVISFFSSFFVVLIFLFFDINLNWPMIVLYQGNFLTRLVTLLWIPFAVPILTFSAIYFYPSTEKGSIEKKINQELPFAVIHMSAISGSGIEPSQIFKIIGLSKEYPYLRREIRKVLNQINLYGYDLVTALNNVAKSTPSSKLAELFSGLTTTINSGGSLTEFFDKRAETLLIGYRLEREKYTKVAETFMDIYISVVIAAPMILMLLLVMIQVSKISVGFSSTQMTAIMIVIIVLINLAFLAILKIKQPTY